MFKKRYSSLVLAALFAALSVAVAARPADRQLMSQLPACDALAGVDLQRLQAETIPAFGALKPKMLDDINRELAKVQEETGIDPRSFDAAAMGFNLQNKSNEQFVALLQGRFEAAALIEKAFAATQKKNAKVTREAVLFEGFTIWQAGAGKKSGERVAVMVLDFNTLAFGELGALRNLVNARLGRAPRVSEDLLNLANRNSSALINFGGNVPAGMFNNIGGKGGDQFANLAGSVRRFAGSVNAAGLNLDADVSLFTENAAQANEMRDTLNGFRLLFNGFRLGNASGKNSDAISRLVKNLQINAQSNEVQLRLILNETDVRQLAGQF
jgi:hypothetical protein